MCWLRSLWCFSPLKINAFTRFHFPRTEHKGLNFFPPNLCWEFIYSKLALFFNKVASLHSNYHYSVSFLFAKLFNNINKAVNQLMSVLFDHDVMVSNHSMVLNLLSFVWFGSLTVGLSYWWGQFILLYNKNFKKKSIPTGLLPPPPVQLWYGVFFISKV